ncbi:MAG: serine/threonine-protein kinase, partial [Acidobacteriota bacterium]|nr:serine/threonine-protein kinase [Acidobacteriota bacterium]
MTLTPGARIGPYEIVGSLGAGGMGQVFKAQDTRLDRTVAIKILSPHLVDDPATRTRFEREARAVSSLDHPNICAVYDVGREANLDYLVMQYVEGETLAARLARGPLPLHEALRYGTEIASALDRAHRSGILHRDLKPGNVMLARSAGRETSARLLDFGLAKVLPIGAPTSTGETVAMTTTSPLTESGTILGTLLYMSPEQLEGQAVDSRSDIFSFGAVLYEMVTGKRAFEGASQASIIAAILERDPPAMTSMAPLTPVALDRVVRKCLAKDRDRRWQTAADLRDELAWITQPSGALAAPPVSRHDRRNRPWTALAAAAVALLALLAVGYAWLKGPGERPAVEVSTRRLTITVPAGLHLARGGIAIAPDGSSIVFVGSESPESAVISLSSRSAPGRLYLRRFDSTELTAVAGTEGARTPFFSPGGDWIGFFTAGALMKVSLRGGPPSRIAGTPPVSRGAAWLPDDSIVLTPTQSSGLMRIPAGETEARPWTTPDEKAGERAHQWPTLLPGGTHLLYTIRRSTAMDVDASDIGIIDIATRQQRVLLKGAAFGRSAATGHLLFVRGNTLSAAPFDLASMEVGSALPIAEQVAVDPWVGGAHYAVAPDGTLVFFRGGFGTERRSPVWVDRNGKSTPVAGITGGVPGHPRFSPDGTRLVYDATSPAGDDEIYLLDLARGTSVAISGDPADDFNPAWTADGSRLVWTALTVGGMPYLVSRSSDGTGPVSRLATGVNALFMGSVSSAGVVAYTQAAPGPAGDIWITSLAQGEPPRPLIATSANEYGPEFSPDGKWIAYVSNEGGTADVYVVPYPGPGAKRRISSSGGVAPAWSRDGAALFFQSGDAM